MNDDGAMSLELNRSMRRSDVDWDIDSVGRLV